MKGSGNLAITLCWLGEGTNPWGENQNKKLFYFIQEKVFWNFRQCLCSSKTFCLPWSLVHFEICKAGQDFQYLMEVVWSKVPRGGNAQDLGGIRYTLLRRRVAWERFGTWGEGEIPTGGLVSMTFTYWTWQNHWIVMEYLSLTTVAGDTLNLNKGGLSSSLTGIGKEKGRDPVRQRRQ